MLRKNLIANVVGQAWTGILSLAFVPAYIHFLGVESYGLVGFFVTLQSLLMVIDLGMSITANRELALVQRQPAARLEAGNLVRTLEIVYTLVAIALVGLVVLGSGWLATNWINVNELSPETVRLAVAVFGVTIGLRWPVSLYLGVLRGLERQVLQNGITMLVAAFRNIGAVLVLVWVSPTVTAFVIWQLFSALIEVSLFALAAWRTIGLPVGIHSRFEWRLLKRVWRFSTRLALISVFAVVLKQISQVLLSRLVTLDQLGYYTAANAATSALTVLVSPIFNAAFPRLTALLAEGNLSKLGEIYHQLSRFVSLVVAGVACALIFFSYDILLVWTRSESVARQAYVVFSLLAVAGMFNAMMQIPYALQLAAGLTWIALYTNGIAIVILTPLSYWLISTYGMNGAGVSWAIFNVFYYLIIPHVLHRYVLREHKVRWIVADTLPFMLIGVMTFGIMRWVSSYVPGVWIAVSCLVIGMAMYTGLSSIYYHPWYPFVKRHFLIKARGGLGSEANPQKS